MYVVHKDSDQQVQSPDTCCVEFPLCKHAHVLTTTERRTLSLARRRFVKRQLSGCYACCAEVLQGVLLRHSVQALQALLLDLLSISGRKALQALPLDLLSISDGRKASPGRLSTWTCILELYNMLEPFAGDLVYIA